MFWKSLAFQILAFVILGTLWNASAALSGTVQSVTFTGPQTGGPVTFTIYLPAGYGAGTNRYPVVYHLHGLGGSHDSPQISTVPESHETVVVAGTIEPCIIVFPDGYRDSFWADSANSAKPAETNVKEEIIPYVDANYRTIPNRERRAIQGFSMGGFGAAKFAAKFPDTFCACAIYDGAMLMWNEIQQRHPVQAAEIFNDSASRFALYSPWHWLTQNVATLRSMPFRQVVGALTSENRNWRDALLSQAIMPAYVETGLPHNLGALLTAEGSNMWAFIASAFANPAPGRLQLRIENSNAVLQWPSTTGEEFDIDHRTNLADSKWQLLASKWPAAIGTVTEYWHSNSLRLADTGFYRVRPTATAPSFTFRWTGTNFTYTDAERSFSGIMLKPAGEGPFPAIVISHGAGGTATGYSLAKARELSAWGAVCIGPTLTHAAGGETNAVNMGHCPENLARITACANILASLAYVDTNRLALFGHSMGAFATIGAAGNPIGQRIRAAAISAGGIIPDSAGTNQAAPTTSEASPVRAPFIMFHCDGDPIVPASRSQSFQQLLIANSAPNQRIVFSSNSIPNTANWHNIHNDPAVNASILTNTRSWFITHGVLP